MNTELHFFEAVCSLLPCHHPRGSLIFSWAPAQVIRRLGPDCDPYFLFPFFSGDVGSYERTFYRPFGCEIRGGNKSPLRFNFLERCDRFFPSSGSRVPGTANCSSKVLERRMDSWIWEIDNEALFLRHFTARVFMGLRIFEEKRVRALYKVYVFMAHVLYSARVLWAFLVFNLCNSPFVTFLFLVVLIFS